MRNQILGSLLGAGLFTGVPVSAFAVPSLQLTILNGEYKPTGAPEYNGETTVATSNPFTLYGLLAAKNADLADKYYLSAALWPRPGTEPNPAPDLGSIEINGTTIPVTAGMVWGQPSGLNQAHGVFDTYYTELEFMFDASKATAEFDAELVTPTSALASGCDVSAGSKDKCMYFQPFDVDVTNLNSGYSIHVDLYDGKFAPFSHDAQSAQSTNGGNPPSGNPPSGAPEPATLALIGLGVVGFGYQRRRKIAAT